jgi:autotransporter-associated beta strand protein
MFNLEVNIAPHRLGDRVLDQLAEELRTGLAYADRKANERAVRPRLTYVLERAGRKEPLTVPKGAEVLLETRQPYLTAEQRREVLRTTALPSGYVLLDGFEQWGRLNLFAAADGYGSFDSDVTVTLDAAKGGFHAADAWRNDIEGAGSLTKRGSGTLTLTGHNRYHGGTVVEEGTLVAGHADAHGQGDVRLTGGTVRAEQPVRVRGTWTQSKGATLDLPLRRGHGAALTVSGRATLGQGSVLSLRLDTERPAVAGTVVPVIDSCALRGQFDKVELNSDTLRAVPLYTADGLSVRLLKR